MACPSSPNPNTVCVEFDGTNWTFSPDTLECKNNGATPVLLQRDGNDWTFKSFAWKDQPPAGVFGDPTVAASTIVISNNGSSKGQPGWRYDVTVTMNGVDHTCDPRIVNM